MPVRGTWRSRSPVASFPGRHDVMRCLFDRTRHGNPHARRNPGRRAAGGDGGAEGTASTRWDRGASRKTEVAARYLCSQTLRPRRQQDAVNPSSPTLPAFSVVPVVNQIRTYWWCSPPRTGRQRMLPARSTTRETGASFSKDRCVRTSL